MVMKHKWFLALALAVMAAMTAGLARAGTINLPRTGQSVSYATGDDGALQMGATLPTPRFRDNGDGTVTDNLTGLIWLKNANCFGATTWAGALTDANGLASGSCGLSDGSHAGDWRLPNVRELRSLINRTYSKPALSNTAGTGQWIEGDPFTGVQSYYYWSSTTYASFIDSAWDVDLWYGDAGWFWNSKVDGLYVWPVRGGQSGVLDPSVISQVPRTGQTQSYGARDDGALQMGAPLPNPRFTDNNNGTVTDNLTGLIWLKNANCANAKRDWPTALSDVASLNSSGMINGNNCGDASNGGSHQIDWRLPNDIELWSLIDFGDFNPALSNNPFTGVHSYFYWSSSTLAGYADTAWAMYLGIGDAGWGSKDSNGYVWPVRGQSGTSGNLTTPSIHLDANGQRNNNSFAVTVTSPVDVTYQITNAAPGQEAFFILDAPAVGVYWYYLNSSYKWMPLPDNLEQMTPCGYILGDGVYTLYQGPWPTGDYLIYLGFDNNKNGHLDFNSLTYDSLLIHVVK